MNLKIEDLEKNENKGGKKDKKDTQSVLSNMISNGQGIETSMSGISIESKNLIQ
jgi:hypothetical protein